MGGVCDGWVLGGGVDGITKQGRTAAALRMRFAASRMPPPLPANLPACASFFFAAAASLALLLFSRAMRRSTSAFAAFYN